MFEKIDMFNLLPLPRRTSSPTHRPTTSLLSWASLGPIQTQLCRATTPQACWISVQPVPHSTRPAGHWQISAPLGPSPTGSPGRHFTKTQLLRPARPLHHGAPNLQAHHAPVTQAHQSLLHQAPTLQAHQAPALQAYWITALPGLCTASPPGPSLPTTLHRRGQNLPRRHRQIGQDAKGVTPDQLRL
jgi:hypothetical protein